MLEFVLVGMGGMVFWLVLESAYREHRAPGDPDSVVVLLLLWGRELWQKQWRKPK